MSTLSHLREGLALTLLRLLTIFGILSRESPCTSLGSHHRRHGRGRPSGLRPAKPNVCRSALLAHAGGVGPSPPRLGASSSSPSALLMLTITTNMSLGKHNRPPEHDHDLLRDRRAASALASIRPAPAHPPEGHRGPGEVQPRADHRGRRWRGRAVSRWAAGSVSSARLAIVRGFGFGPAEDGGGI